MTDTILLIAGAVPTTDRMIAYALAAAERAKERGWWTLTIGEELLQIRSSVTSFGVSEDSIHADEVAMELCDKILLIGSDERIQAMFDYLMTLYDHEIWWVTWQNANPNTLHKVTEPKPELAQMSLF